MDRSEVSTVHSTCARSVSEWSPRNVHEKSDGPFGAGIYSGFERGSGRSPEVSLYCKSAFVREPGYVP